MPVFLHFFEDFMYFYAIFVNNYAVPGDFCQGLGGPCSIGAWPFSAPHTPHKIFFLVVAPALLTAHFPISLAHSLRPAHTRLTGPLRHLSSSSWL